MPFQNFFLSLNLAHVCCLPLPSPIQPQRMVLEQYAYVFPGSPDQLPLPRRMYRGQEVHATQCRREYAAVLWQLFKVHGLWPPVLERKCLHSYLDILETEYASLSRWRRIGRARVYISLDASDRQTPSCGAHCSTTNPIISIGSLKNGSNSPSVFERSTDGEAG